MAGGAALPLDIPSAVAAMAEGAALPLDIPSDAAAMAALAALPVDIVTAVIHSRVRSHRGQSHG